MSNDSTQTQKSEKKEKLELLKIEEKSNGVNNYAAFEVKSTFKLKAYDKWKYVDSQDPLSDPPVIPKLVEEKTIEIEEPETGEKRQWVIKGNKDEVEKAKKDAKPWYEESMKVLSLIADAVPANRLHLVQHCKTAKEAWLAIQREYRPSNAVTTTTLKSNIMSYRYEPGMKVTNWRDDLEAMYAHLCTLDPTAMRDSEFAHMIVTLMPHEGAWQYVWNELNAKFEVAGERGQYVPSKFVIDKIREVEYRLQSKDPQAQDVMMTAKADLVSRKRQASSTADVNQVSLISKKPRMDKSHLRCENPACERKMGHTREECLAYGGGMAGKYWEDFRGPRFIHLKPGYQERETARRKWKERSATGGNSARVNMVDDLETRANPASNCTGDTDSRDIFSFATQFIEDAVCAARALDITEPKENGTYHDSGASRHVFHNRRVFSDYEEFTAAVKVKGFDSSVEAAVLGRGTVHLTCRSEGRECTVNLSDVLHVPNTRCNLVSQTQLDI
jgi:hypothetical protein